MSDSFRTMIVRADDVKLARSLASLSPGGEGMFTTPLSFDGHAPASHYISTGLLPDSFVAVLPFQYWAIRVSNEGHQRVCVGKEPGNPEAVYVRALEAGLEVTLQEIIDLFNVCDVTTQDPFVAMGRMGLKLVNEGE